MFLQHRKSTNLSQKPKICVNMPFANDISAMWKQYQIKIKKTSLGNKSTFNFWQSTHEVCDKSIWSFLEIKIELKANYILLLTNQHAPSQKFTFSSSFKIQEPMTKPYAKHRFRQIHIKLFLNPQKGSIKYYLGL